MRTIPALPVVTQFNNLEAGQDNMTHRNSHGKLPCQRLFTLPWDSVCTLPAHKAVYVPPTAGSTDQQCCLAGLGAARADLIFVADSACKYAFVRFHCG